MTRLRPRRMHGACPERCANNPVKEQSHILISLCIASILSPVRYQTWCKAVKRHFKLINTICHSEKLLYASFWFSQHSKWSFLQTSSELFLYDRRDGIYQGRAQIKQSNRVKSSRLNIFYGSWNKSVRIILLARAKNESKTVKCEHAQSQTNLSVIEFNDTFINLCRRSLRGADTFKLFLNSCRKSSCLTENNWLKTVFISAVNSHRHRRIVLHLFLLGVSRRDDLVGQWCTPSGIFNGFALSGTPLK